MIDLTNNRVRLDLTDLGGKEVNFDLAKNPRGGYDIIMGVRKVLRYGNPQTMHITDLDSHHVAITLCETATVISDLTSNKVESFLTDIRQIAHELAYDLDMETRIYTTTLQPFGVGFREYDNLLIGLDKDADELDLGPVVDARLERQLSSNGSWLRP